MQQSGMPADKRSKKISQHVLSEALDCDGPRKLLAEAFKWTHAHLPWWQLLIYFVEPESVSGTGESMHVSMLSEIRTIERKALYNINQIWHPFTGIFEGVTV